MSPGDVRPAPAVPDPRAGKPWAAWGLAALFYAGAIGLAVLYGLHMRPERQQRKARLDNAVAAFNPASAASRDAAAAYRELQEALAQYETTDKWSDAVLIGTLGSFAVARVIMAYARRDRK